MGQDNPRGQDNVKLIYIKEVLGSEKVGSLLC